MNEIKLNNLDLINLNLKTLTKQDILDYCSINNLNLNDIIKLYLNDNKLTDITGIKLFKNLISLNLENNELTDISVLKDLNKLKTLSIGKNKITDISAVQYLNKLKILSISNLELPSDQIQYINSLNNLESLGCYNGFKDMSVLNKLNKNIKIFRI